MDLADICVNGTNALTALREVLGAENVELPEQVDVKDAIDHCVRAIHAMDDYLAKVDVYRYLLIMALYEAAPTGDAARGGKDRYAWAARLISHPKSTVFSWVKKVRTSLGLLDEV